MWLVAADQTTPVEALLPSLKGLVQHEFPQAGPDHDGGRHLGQPTSEAKAEAMQSQARLALS